MSKTNTYEKVAVNYKGFTVAICNIAVVPKPLHEVPPTLHILYVSLFLTHALQVLLPPLMSWWVESGVIDEGEIQIVQGWRYSRIGLKTTALC